MKSALMTIALLATISAAYAQVDNSFGIDPTNIYPLAALQQTFEEPQPTYLFEKPKYYSPDEMLEHPIGVSINQFPALKLDSAKRKLKIFHSGSYEMSSVYGAAITEQPTLYFFTDQLYKLSFEIATGNQDILKSLKNRYGKPKKAEEAFSNGSYQAYTWEGYKINIKLILQKEKTSQREILVIEDKLLSKVVDADLEQRQFVQQAMLFSDVVSIYR